MNVPRAQIFAALEDILFGAMPWKAKGRRVPLPNQVQNFPACFFRETGGEYLRHSNRIFAATVIEVEIFVFTQSGAASDSVPSDALDLAVEAIEAALAPDDPQQNRLTLGGLVQHCWLEGQAHIDPGDINQKGQAEAILPLKILTPWVQDSFPN